MSVVVRASLPHRRWPIMTLLTLAIFVTEVIEHQPEDFPHFSPQLLTETLVFRLILLLLNRIALNQSVPGNLE